MVCETPRVGLAMAVALRGIFRLVLRSHLKGRVRAWLSMAPPWEAEGKGLWKFKERHLPSRLYTQPSGCSGVVQRSSMTINSQRGRQRDGEMGWGTGSEPALAGIWSSHRLRAQKRCGLFWPLCFRQAKFAPAEPIFEHNPPPGYLLEVPQRTGAPALR